MSPRECDGPVPMTEAALVAKKGAIGVDFYAGALSTTEQPGAPACCSRSKVRNKKKASRPVRERGIQRHRPDMGGMVVEDEPNVECVGGDQSSDSGYTPPTRKASIRARGGALQRRGAGNRGCGSGRFAST
jgi:hypothetical protein